MHTGLELVRRTDTSLARSKRVGVGVSVAMMLSLPFVLAMVPLTTLLCVGGFVATCGALAALPWPKRDPNLYPDDIADPQLRLTYVSILAARAELEAAVENAPACASGVESLEQHCRDAVRLCARIAPVANRLHGYLAHQELFGLAQRATELRAKAAATTDPVAARALAQAASSYERQIASCETLIRTRERIQARLELVLASLRAFAATVVKQQTLEDEQLALAGETVAEHVDGVREELAVLESALDLDAT